MSTTARSSVCGRLHGVFTKKPAAAAPAAAPPAATPSATVPKSGGIKELYKTRSLERLVAKFKESSKERKFRARWGIYDETVRRCIRANRRDWIEEILEEQKKYRDISREGFNVRLIRLYGDAGMFEHARKVFDEMPERETKRTSLSFNALISAAVHSRKYELAKELFEELPAELEIKPDAFSYNIVIKGLCEAGSLDSAASLFDEMEGRGCTPNVVTFNILLDEFYRNARFEDGNAIWARLMNHENVSPDVKSYSAKLMGLAKQKRSQEAVELLAEMKEKELEPDPICLHNLVLAFVNEANVEAAKHWYGEMKRRECKPHRMTFAALIPFVCGEEGEDVDFAFELAKDIYGMKHVVNQGLLQRVVDALAKAGKVKEAEEVIALGTNNGYYQYSKLCLPSTSAAQ